MKKRILSGLLVAAMLLASLPTAAFAADDTNAEAPDTGETQTILPQSEEDAEQSTVTAPSYEVSTTAELSNALTQIATSADTEATIVLKADVTLSNDATSGYISFFGANGKHITVKSDEGEMKKLSFLSYGVLTGDCTFDNVNVTGSRLFCNGYRTIFTENGQIHLRETLYGGGYKTTVDSTYVVIAASGYINPSSSSGLHDVIGGSYQGNVVGDTYLEITGDIQMQSGNHLNPGCMKGDGSSGDGRNVPDVYVGGNATLIYDNKNSTDTASPAIEGTYGCEMKGDVTLDVRAGCVAGIVGTEEPLEESIFKKISMFCNVKPDCVIENITLPFLYEAPLMLERENFSSIVCRELGIDAPAPELGEWRQMVESIKNRTGEVNIGLVGKYVQLHDAYLSVNEALNHAGYALNTCVHIHWIDSEGLTEADYKEKLSGLDGILVPGGFGGRGIAGMILAARYARENDLPYFGICLGMQVAVIEYARNVAGITKADSGEFDELCPDKVIDFMPGQSENIDKGGTLRLGAYPCVIKEGTTMQRCYGALEISERHRHRYEFNNEYRDVLTQSGLTLSGLSPDGRLVETVELSDRPFYVGVQFHPEFKSRPNKAHPLFLGFISAAKDEHERREK